MSAIDETPERSELTADDVALLEHDRAKPAHNAATCTVAGCWVCAWEASTAPTLGGAV